MAYKSLFGDNDDDCDLFAFKKPSKPRAEESLQIISYAVIEEKEFEYLGTVNEDGVVCLRQIEMPPNASGILKSTVIKRWTIAGCKLLVYFQGRNKLACFTGSNIAFMDVVTGKEESVNLPQHVELSDKATITALVECNQNTHKQNVIPYSVSSYFVLTPVAAVWLFCVDWKSEKPNVRQNKTDCFTYCSVFCGGQLWTSFHGITRYQIKEDMTATKTDNFGSSRHFQAMAICQRGVLASNETYILLFNPKGEQLLSLKTPVWNSNILISWLDHIAAVSEEAHGLFCDQRLVTLDFCGKGFSSLGSNCSKMFVWKRMLFLVSKNPCTIEYRSGHMKSNPSDCLLASVPKEIIREIQSQLKPELSLDTCNFNSAKELSPPIEVRTPPFPPLVTKSIFDDDWCATPAKPKSKARCLFDADSDNDLFAPLPATPKPAVHHTTSSTLGLFGEDDWSPDSSIFDPLAPMATANPSTKPTKKSLFDDDD